MRFLFVFSLRVFDSCLVHFLFESQCFLLLVIFALIFRQTAGIFTDIGLHFLVRSDNR